MSYTKGPWEWDDGYHGLYGSGPRNEILGYDRYEGMWLAHHNTDANARLIAAAPDMMDFIKQHEAWEADLIMNGDWSNEMPRLTQHQYDEMLRLQGLRNAIINKAKGE